MNDFGLSPQKKTLVKLDNGIVSVKLEAGLDGFLTDRYCLVLTYYDNMGFKTRGKRVGYKQYTKLIHVVVTREELIMLGIYPDPNNPDAPVKDRTRKKWLQERVANGFNEVCAPLDEDYNLLAASSLSSLESILKLKSEGGRAPVV